MPAWVDDPFAGSVSPAVAAQQFTYTPEAQATSARQTGRVYRGSGVAFELNPAAGATAIVASDYEATLGVPGAASFLTYSVTDGNMTVDETTGEILVNPTEAETLALSLYQPIQLQLWRTATDDTRTVVGRVWLTVVETNNP